MASVNVFTICGSLRKGSYNAMVQRALPGLAPEGMTLKAAPSYAELPLYNADIQNSNSCIAGYSCGNEGSVREFQRKTTQWDRRSLRRFAQGREIAVVSSQHLPEIPGGSTGRSCSRTTPESLRSSGRQNVETRLEDRGNLCTGMLCARCCGQL